MQGGGARGSAEPCGLCGSDEVDSSLVTEEFVYGVGADAVTLSARIPVRKCAACGFEYSDADAEDARHEAVCRHLGVLTPNDIIAIRQANGLTRAEFALLTHLGEATIARWERGALIQNVAYDRYLRLLQAPQGMSMLRRIEARDSSTTQQPPRVARRFRSISAAQQSQLMPLQQMFELRKVA